MTSVSTKPPPAVVSPTGAKVRADAFYHPVARLPGVQAIASLNGAGRRQALPELHTKGIMFRVRACYGRAAV
jgi:hypothetical protein